MKKFLCYDTNDAASGKINVDSRGMLKPNSTIPSTNGATNQQLVTDSNGNVQWEDRLAYDDSKVVVDLGYGIQLVKVVDEIPPWASIDAPIKIWPSNGESKTSNPESHRDLGNGSFTAGEFVFIIATDNFEIPFGETPIVFQEKGVYFASVPDNFYVTGVASADSDTPEITWDGNIGEVKKLDEKYLPDTVATKSEVKAAQSVAKNAQNAASTANNAAKNAQTTANNAINAATGSVKFTSSQNLTDAQKKQARTNIGAGTSSFSGRYDDLTNKPTAVQSDWEVNDNSDAAYIKNRTHYDYATYSYITFLKSPTANSLINDTYYYGEVTGSSLAIEEGSIYKVICSNGTIYISTCKKVPVKDQPLVNKGRVLGNAQLGVDAGYLDITNPHHPVTDVDTGEPWCFISFSHTAKNAIISTIPSFSINNIYVQTAHELKQLDEKYIPSTIQRVGDDPILSSSTEGSTKKFKITVDDSGAISATEVTL